MIRRLSIYSFFVLSLVFVGCAATPIAAQTPSDTAPARSEPRADLRLLLDLRTAQDCEESFDLALYRNRAVELIEWDNQKGICKARQLRIRYLSTKIQETELMREVASIAERISPAITQPSAPKSK